MTSRPASLLASLAPSQVDTQDEVDATPEVQQDFEPKNRRKNYKWDKTDNEWLMEHCAKDLDIKTQYEKFCDFVKNKSTCEPSFILDDVGSIVVNFIDLTAARFLLKLNLPRLQRENNKNRLGQRTTKLSKPSRSIENASHG